MNAGDPVERALGLLRGESGAELPDPGIEARLRRRCLELSRRRRVAIWPIFAVTVLSGAGFAATNLDWLRRWWFHVEVDGTHRSGVVEGDGERSFTFESADGGTGTVLVHREHAEDGAVRTAIDVRREASGQVEHERSELVTGGGGMALLPSSVLEGALSMHSATDRAGRIHEIFARLDGQGGSQLFVQHAERAGDSVEELARVPFDVLREGARVEITELPDGGLELGFDDGGGAAIQFAWSCAGAPAEPVPAVLETPDAKVRIRVEELPRER